MDLSVVDMEPTLRFRLPASLLKQVRGSRHVLTVGQVGAESTWDFFHDDFTSKEQGRGKIVMKKIDCVVMCIQKIG